MCVRDHMSSLGTNVVRDDLAGQPSRPGDRNLALLVGGSSGNVYIVDRMAAYLVPLVVARGMRGEPSITDRYK